MPLGKPIEYDYTLKVILIGDADVGKSSALDRFVRETYSEELRPTIHAEFKEKAIESRGMNILLQMWDTAGQEQYRSVMKSYYRGAHAALICFALTVRETFESVSRWEHDVKEAATDEVVLLLLGLKADLAIGEGRAVGTAEATEFADGHGMLYFEASAKTGVGVTSAFTALGEALAQRAESGVYALEQSAAEYTPKAGKRGCC
jgi:small GTP-binding protein